MSSSLSKELVIDTDIVASATEKDHPISSACREFLMAVLRICHRIILTDKIDEEWTRHQTMFVRTWRGSMARRGKINRDRDCPEDVVLRRQLSRLELESYDQAAVMKDIHLLDAALRSDKRIASKDETVRRILKQHNKRLHSIRDIIWVNPVNETEKPLQWLEQGAPSETNRALGSETKP